VIALADPAVTLTAGQVGLLDTKFTDVRKVLSDKLGNVEAAAAYNAFRNTMRHALYGSALTPGEIESFDAAFGKMGQQLGPVLDQFKVALSQTKARLDSTANMTNPYTSKVLLGADQAKLAKIQDALQARIDYMERKRDPNYKSPAEQANRPSLDSIFGGQ
jgi:hypothetical protein